MAIHFVPVTVSIGGAFVTRALRFRTRCMCCFNYFVPYLEWIGMLRCCQATAVYLSIHGPTFRHRSLGIQRDNDIL